MTTDWEGVIFYHKFHEGRICREGWRIMQCPAVRKPYFRVYFGCCTEEEGSRKLKEGHDRKGWHVKTTAIILPHKISRWRLAAVISAKFRLPKEKKPTHLKSVYISDLTL